VSWRAVDPSGQNSAAPYWLLYLCAKRWRPLPSSPACSRKPPQSVLPPLDCDRARHPGNRLIDPAPKPRASVYIFWRESRRNPAIKLTVPPGALAAANSEIAMKTSELCSKPVATMCGTQPRVNLE